MSTEEQLLAARAFSRTHITGARNRHASHRLGEDVHDHA